MLRRHDSIRDRYSRQFECAVCVFGAHPRRRSEATSRCFFSAANLDEAPLAHPRHKRHRFVLHKQGQTCTRLVFRASQAARRTCGRKERGGGGNRKDRLIANRRRRQRWRRRRSRCDKGASCGVCRRIAHTRGRLQRRFTSPPLDVLMQTSARLATSVVASSPPLRPIASSIKQMSAMSSAELVAMLSETDDSRRAGASRPFSLPQAVSCVFWPKFGLKNVALSGAEFDTRLGGVSGVTVRALIEEIYVKACERREWSW